MEEPACKRDPVRGFPRRRPSVSPAPSAGGGPFAGPLRSTRKLGRATLERFLLDLAPDGGCRAAAVARRAGGLLPHRCTLTAHVAARGGVLSVAPSRGRPRLALASVLPCGVRTFLERRSARGRPAGSSARNATGCGPGRPARCRRRGSRAGPPRCSARAGRARRSRGRSAWRAGEPGDAAAAGVPS